jgi:PAS domain S-box-containing protein
MPAATASLNGNDLKDLSILYVEDDDEIREQLCQFLRRRVGTLYTATNGREGLESFRAHQPDIVVSDIRMPIMDGLEMVDLIKREKPITPVIMTTAFNETSYFLRSIDIGVDKYVMKPVRIEALVDAIDRSASGLHAERQLRLAATVFDTAAEAIVVVDRRCRVVSGNLAANSILEYPGHALPGLELDALNTGCSSERPATDWATVCGEQPWRGETWLTRAGGERFPAWLSAVGARSADGEIIHHVLVFLDISERKRREAEILDLNRRLQAARDDLERRVEERTRDLVEARDAAEMANRAKSQFLSHMSHELRTPMNAVIGFAELLHNDAKYPLEAGQKRYTGEILKAGWHLVDLINDVLDMAKVEAGKLAVDNQPTPLAEVLRECLVLTRPMAERRSIQINVRPELFERLMVRADRMRLKQVLVNLLSNAVKYNRESGRIDIVCQPRATTVRLGISDTGLGISAEDMSRLFRPFERFGANMANQDGTGIGLALSKRLAELMGGQIAVDSQAGVGSTFWLELEWVGGAMDSTATALSSASGSGPKADDGMRLRTVLYIEDNKINVLYLQALCASLPGIRLLPAEQPEQALSLPLADRPDLILVDVGLHGMNCLDLLARLRATPVLQSVPVVALSIGATPEEIARCQADGFAGHLTIPVQMKELQATMRRLIGGMP